MDNEKEEDRKGSGDGRQTKGQFIFSGSALETTASIDLDVDSNMLRQINRYNNMSLRMQLISLDSSMEDMSVKIYEDAFSSVDKTQLFSEFSPFPSDAVIVFEDNREVHVNKTLLSMHSGFWKEMFAEGQDRISLINVVYDEFVDLLCVIYPTRHPITANNVETLSKLAHKFEMPHLLNQGDIFLTANCTKFGRSKLLLLAQNYNLGHLQAQCISAYKSIDDVKAIKAEPEYSNLDDRTKRMLLDEILRKTSLVPSVYLKPETRYESKDLATSETREAVILETLYSSTWCSPNIVLVVGDRRIQAHKDYLSVHSQYFNGMFQSGFKEGRENEIVLEEINYLEMLELLTVVYPSEHSVTETNLGNILKLADRFIMPAILTRCKKVLMSSNNIKGALKLWYAQRYNFTDLQEEFARHYKTIADVMKIKVEPEFEALDDKTRALILDSITQQNRYR